MDGHYDGDADIAWLRLKGWHNERVQVDETDHGLVEPDRASGRVLGLEFWEASRRLPAELLDELPSPPARDVVIEQQPA